LAGVDQPLGRIADGKQGSQRAGGGGYDGLTGNKKRLRTETLFCSRGEYQVFVGST
jgi:hypothetical protein